MSLFKENIFFLIPYLVLLIAGFWINMEYSQKEILLGINRHNSVFADTFLRYYTNLGDGVFFLFVIVLLSFIKFRYAVCGLAAWAIQGISVQLLKHIVFPERTRPWEVLKQDKSLHLVPDFHPFLYNSFPSGHSATAFCLFAFLSFISNKKWVGLVCILLAALVAYSRIYLVQHFFIDTYYGSLLGVISAIIATLCFCNKRLQRRWDLSILQLKRVKA